MSDVHDSRSAQDEPEPATSSTSTSSGPRLVLVVLAILLSMFLVALDMVIAMQLKYSTPAR